MTILQLHEHRIVVWYAITGRRGVLSASVPTACVPAQGNLTAPERVCPLELRLVAEADEASLITARTDRVIFYRVHIQVEFITLLRRGRKA